MKPGEHLITHCVYCGSELPRDQWVYVAPEISKLSLLLQHQEVFCSKKCLITAQRMYQK